MNLDLNMLIVAKSGDYFSCDRSLSVDGEKQIDRLAERIKEITKGGNAIIVHSATTDAWESAISIANCLGIFPETHIKCFTKDGEIGNIEDITNCISNDKKVIILVTHSNNASSIVEYLGKIFFDKQLQCKPILNGEAVGIYLPEKIIFRC